MGKSKAEHLMHQLLEQHPTTVLAWLNRVERGEEEVPPDFHWAGLAETATFNIWPPDPTTATAPNLDWVQVAVSVYEYLAGKLSSNQDYFSDMFDLGANHDFTEKAIGLRASMITQLGSVPNHSVLDVDRLVRLFLLDRTLSHERIMQIINVEGEDRHKKVTRSEYLELVSLRNQLRLIRKLIEQGQLQPNAELNEWLALQEALTKWTRGR